MLIKKVRPSRSSTATEVFKFWLKFGMHEIPKEHHYNMLMGIGCKDRTLKRFINACYCFDEKSVVEAIVDSQKQKKSILNKDFLVQHFTEHLEYGFDVQNEIAKVKGIEWMFERGFILDKQIIEKYLRNASQTLLKSLIPYAKCLEKAEKDVLGCGYVPLVIAYIKAVRRIEKNNVSQLLVFNDVEIYKIFFDEYSYDVSEKFITTVLKDKSDEIVKELASFIRLNATQEILLIKRGKFSLLKAQLDSFGNVLCKESIDYLALNADDEMFKSFAKHPKVDVNEGNYPDSFYERLFKLGDKDMLRSYIRSSYLPSKFEEELLKLNDKELIKEYFGENGQVYTNKTAIHILRNGTKEQIDELLESDYSIGFYGEAWLFKSGLNDYIKRYLKNRSLTGFGEACLVKFASKEIVKQWLTDNILIGELSFVAAMERKDEEIINRLIELSPYFYEKDRDLEAFMLYAPSEVIAHFFENLEENEYMNTDLEVSEEVASKIFATRSIEVQKLFVHWFDCFDNVEHCNSLIRFADKEIVLEKLKESDFSFNLELLLKRGDVELINAYIENNELMDGSEEMMLLQTLDEDLVLKYHEDYGFGCIEESILDE